MKFFYFFILVMCFSCSSKEEHIKNLRSGDVNKINEACFYLGEEKDTTAIVEILTHIKDSRVSHNLRFKGMSVCYCRLGALKKISGVDYNKINERIVDTAAINLYLNWAVSKRYIKDKSEIQLEKN